MFVGIDHDTPAFAVESIAKWWKQDGSKKYEGCKKLLVLADAGGSNGYRPRAWKYELQKKLCDPFGLCVAVCHYPPGASKWNPIEHRLFSAISNNWKGMPLNSYETIIKYLRKTKTTPKKGIGLKVKATFWFGRDIKKAKKFLIRKCLNFNWKIMILCLIGITRFGQQKCEVIL